MLPTPPIPYDASRSALFHPERRETVFSKGGRPVGEPLAVEAARLAYLRFEESPGERSRLGAALALAGFEALQTFDCPGANGEGFGAVREDLALLAFRGTEADSLSDLVTDASTAMREWKGMVPGRVHAGFRNIAAGLWEEVEPWLQRAEVRDRPLLICGHSLGAAIATLLAVPARAAQLITIGSPRVGDEAFVASLTGRAGLQIRRIVNCCDVVTRIPPNIPVLPFRHAGEPIYLDKDGNICLDISSSQVDADRSSARQDFLVNHAFKFGTVLVRELADHAPINYVRAYWPA